MSTATVTTTRTGRKIRGDSKLDQLNPAQQEQLRHWLEAENCTYSNTAFLLKHYFGVTVSQSTVFAYYHRHIAPDRHEDDMDAAAAFASLEPGDFDTPTITKAKALAFTSLARPQPQVRTAARLLDLVHRAGKHEIALKRLALEERRVALREALASPPSKPRASSPSSRRHPAEGGCPASPPPPLDTPSPSAPSAVPANAAPPFAAPTPCLPAPVQPQRPPSPNLPYPASPTPLTPPPISGSSLPSSSSVQFPPPPAPTPSPSPTSQKSPQNPPLFSGSFDLLRPATPPSTTPLPAPSAASVPIVPPPPPASPAPAPTAIPSSQSSRLPASAARPPAHAYPQPLPFAGDTFRSTVLR